MTVVDKMARLAMIAHNGVNRKGKGNVPYIADVARTASAEIVVVKIADRLCNTLEFMADGDVEHARAYLGYGEPLRERIMDCRYAEAMLMAISSSFLLRFALDFDILSAFHLGEGECK